MSSISSPTIIMTVASIALLLIIASTFLYLNFKTLRDDIGTDWKEINKKTRLRIDKLPNLIETIRKFTTGQETLIDEIIRLRNEIWPLRDPSAKKVQLELQLSSDLHDLWALVAKNSALANDINFLALHKEIVDFGKEIDEMTDRYNAKIHQFNSQIHFILFRPFALLLRFSKLTIFEFEA